MVSPNWGLAGGNALGMFQLGTQIGGQVRQQRDEKRERNALTAYANDPNEQNLAGVAEYNPEFVIRQRGAQAQAAQQQAIDRRNDLPFLGKLLPTIRDEASYQQARTAAQRYGVDVSDWGETYDPAQVEASRTMVAAVQTPEGQEALSAAGKLAADMGFRPGTPEYNAKVGEIFQAEQVKTVPFQAGGGIASVNTATGQVTPLVVPQGYGGGSGLPGTAPAQQDLPRIANPQEAMRLPPGSRFLLPDGRIGTVPGGGGGGNVTGGFLDGV